MKSLYDFQNYKTYLEHVIDSGPKGGWGSRSKISEAMGIQVAYLSRVLGGKADLSLEQALLFAKFTGLSEEETDFFLLLVEYGRAGSVALRERFLQRIKTVQDKRLVLKERFKVKQVMSPEDQATYYSSWHFAAIHVMLSIPEMQSKKALAEALHLPLAKVSEVVGFLLSVGLAKEEKGRIVIGEARVHVGTDSPLLARHLVNWRLQAMAALDRPNARNLHYASIVTLSKKDVLRIREVLVKAIEEANSIVAPSPEEVLQCVSLDFFSVG